MDFEAGEIRWRAENDTKAIDVFVPVSDSVWEALVEVRRERLSSEMRVFPSSADPGKPSSPELLDDWLRRLYELAGLEPRPGGMRRAFWRQWATERKRLSPVDVAAAGG